MFCVYQNYTITRKFILYISSVINSNTHYSFLFRYFCFYIST
jgi:hypothetical protein